MEIFFYVAFINLLRNILVLRLNTALNFMFNNDATNASVPQFREKVSHISSFYRENTFFYLNKRRTRN